MLDRLTQAAAAAAAITERARRVTSIEVGAEIGDSADWYLIICAPDCDAKAARWLHRRRFGFFQPMMKIQRQSDGRTTREPAFPGYLFAYVWDIDKHYNRLMSLPGIESMLLECGAPYRVPVDFIKALYELDWIEAGANAAGERVAVHSGRHQRRRRRRKSRKISTPQQRRAAQLLTKDLQQAGNLAPDGRIGLLLKALTPSVAGPLVSGRGS